MKVTVKEKSETKEYPWIGIHDDGCIVLFYERGRGTCLNPSPFGDKTYIGEYRTDWIWHGFKTFEGEIVLSNS